MTIIVNDPIGDILEAGKNFCVVFFSNEMINEQSSTNTFYLPSSFGKRKDYLKKKRNVILISTIILLNLAFSQINYRKGASTIVVSQLL